MRAKMETEAKRMMLLTHCEVGGGEEDVQYEIDAGPMWSHANITCALPVQSGNKRQGYLHFSNLPKFYISSHLGFRRSRQCSPATSLSQPGSRVQSRKPSASPSRSITGTTGKKIRPRSAYISPQARDKTISPSSQKSNAPRIIKSRAGSMSPSKHR